MLYLVGDIFDIKRLRRRSYWPAAHRAVVRAILAKARAGTRVIYVPGNHDPDLRGRPGKRRNGIEVRHEVLHETADGRHLLVVHGDEQQPQVNSRPWLYRMGCMFYLSGVRASEIVGGARRRTGLGYWSLSSFLKDQLLDRVALARAFKANLAAEARRRGADGVVCGHIHHALVEQIDGVTYYNDGASRSLGYSPEEVMGTFVGLFYPSVEEARTQTPLILALSSHPPCLRL